MVLNRIASVEVQPLVEEMAGYRNVWIGTALLNIRENFSATNALKQSKGTGLDGFPAELLIATSSVSRDLLLPLVQ